MVVASCRPTAVKTLSSEELKSLSNRLLVHSNPRILSLRHKTTHNQDCRFSACTNLWTNSGKRGRSSWLMISARLLRIVSKKSGGRTKSWVSVTHELRCPQDAFFCMEPVSSLNRYTAAVSVENSSVI